MHANKSDFVIVISWFICLVGDLTEERLYWSIHAFLKWAHTHSTLKWTDQFRVGESQRWGWRWLAPLPDWEPAKRMWMSRQTTCPVTAHPLVEWGQRLTPPWVCAFQRSHHKIQKQSWRAALPAEQQTLHCCDRSCCQSEKLSFTWTENG